MPKIEWREIEWLPNGIRYRKFIDGKPTNGYKLELLSGDPTIDEQVGASADDAKETESTGSMALAATSVSMDSSADASARQWGGHRWTGISIDQSVTIDVCYAEFYVYTTIHDDPNFNIHFEKGASPAIFSNVEHNITGRTRTTASASWIATGVGVGWKGSSISLVTPMQEVVDNSAITAVVLITRPNQDAYKRFRPRSWDNLTDPEHTWGAKLHIEYTAAGGQDYPISLSPGLTASATVAYAVAWDRGMSPGLTADAVIARKLAYDRATSPGLTISATIAKAFGRLITTTADLTVSVTVAKLVAYRRAVTADLTAAVTIIKGWGRSIATTANLTVAVIIAITTGWKITTNTALMVSATINRTVTYSRAVSAGLTASVSIVASHFTGLIRTFYYYLKGST